MNKKQNISIRYKLISIFIIVVITLLISSILTIRAVNAIEKAYNNLTSSIYKINDLVNTNNEILYKIETLVGSRDRDYIDKTYVIIQDFKEKLHETKRENLDLKSQMYLKDVTNLFESTYVKNFETLIYRMRAGDNQGVLTYYNEVEKSWEYIDDYLKRIIDSRIVESRIVNDKINKATAKFLYINQAILIIIVILVGFFIYFIGAPIIIGLTALSKNAEKVANGDFDIKVLKVDSYDEIGVLTIAFNKLIFNTKRLIKQIQTNANLEVKLHKNEADKNRIKALLKESELLALQSQINPHFLFNTLNIIAKTAIIEDAEETCELIETVSDMIRYNLRKLGEAATLKEEIESIDNYFVIQKSRFADRFSYEIFLEEKLLTFKIPFLTLQPIVENAFIHGIEPLEKGGKIKINCYQDEKVHIDISDNGVGMSENKIKELLSNFKTSRGHTTGIGIANVQKRLMLFFEDRCEFDIISKKNEGSTFKITITPSLDIEKMEG